MAGERVDHTLSATALVHEGFLRLFGEQFGKWNDSRHFFVTASRVMQHVLTDHARRKLAAKRSGDGRLEFPSPYPADELAAVGQLMDRLESIDNRAAEVVRLRFYMGMTEAETAEVLGIGRALVQQDWKWARAWLRGAMNGAWGNRSTEPDE